MSELLKSVYNPDNFQQMGRLVLDKLVQRLRSYASYKYHIIDANEEKAFWEDFFNQPFDLEELLDKSISRSVRLHHPHYIGHQMSPPAPLAILGGLLADFLNNGMGVYEMGVVSTAWERIIIDKLLKKIGYESGASGFLTSGGSLANLTGLLCARSKYGSTSKKQALMVSEMTHYSVTKSAMILGLDVIKVPVDDRYAMDTSSLEGLFTNYNSTEQRVIGVVGNACSTATGSFDDLIAIHEFCHRHNLWFHVDGAHGGSYIFSTQYRDLVKGIELADSLVIDFHKMLMTPSICTALLFKDGKDSYRTYQHEADYLWQNEHEEWHNLAKRTFECTKFMMSFKILPMWIKYGDQLFDDFVTTLADSGKVLADLVMAHPKFELAIDPPCNIVCFRWVEGAAMNLNALNQGLRKKLIESGEFYIVQTTIKGKVYLRCTVMNPFTRSEHFKKLLTTLENIHDRSLTIPTNELKPI